MTLHAHNVHKLRGPLKLAEKLGVTRFYLNRLIPAGRGREARTCFKRSKGTVFTVSEALSGYSPIWRANFGDELSNLVRKYAGGFGG